MIKRHVYHLSVWKCFLLLPVYVLIRLWYMTLRVKLTMDAKTLLKTHPTHPCVFYFWHHNLFVAPLLRKYRKNRQMYGLMSASRDGAWLEALVKKFHVQSIRGSSTWRGAQALKDLNACMHANCDIIITPDGPKGPRKQCKPGSLQWAKQHNCSIILLHFDMPRAWKLHSWDQFRLPYPFSTIHVSAQTLSTDLPFDTLYALAQKNL